MRCWMFALSAIGGKLTESLEGIETGIGSFVGKAQESGKLTESLEGIETSLFDLLEVAV